MIPLCNVAWQYEQLKDQIDHAVQEVLAAGRYILGPNVKAFESEICDYLGCDYAVGVNSGTDALHLALRGLGVGPGDEVITTPFSFVATTEAILMVGATPVFVDIDPRTCNLDPHRIGEAITPRTKAILPVHLYGLPCEMDAVLATARRHSLFVVEDCAQAIGAEYHGKRVGVLGDAGCFSFFPSKNLGCCGDGGMLVTGSQALYERVEMLRRHGGRVKYRHTEQGLNSRLDELQAAILRVKLPQLDAWNQLRRDAAALYDSQLGDHPAIDTPSRSLADTRAEMRPVFHQYTIQADSRDALKQSLREAGIQSFAYYPIPLHLQEVHADLGYARGDFPHAERLAERCLSLPMFPGLTASQQSEVCEALRRLASSFDPKPIAA